MSASRSWPVIAAAALLAACGGSSSGAVDPGPTTPATVTPSKPASIPPSPSPSPSASEDTGRVEIAITVNAAGKVSGADRRTRVARGSEVKIEVDSAIADEVHLHGYDISVDAVPGETAELEFTADKTGTFEVELEERKILLTRLQVQ
jgi:hypothetical protein